MSQTGRFSRRLCGGQLAPEGLRLDVIGADPLAVDLDDRDQLAVARLEFLVAVDRNLHQLEPQLVAKLGEPSLGAYAEMTALRFVEDDPGRLLWPGTTHLVTDCYLDIGLRREPDANVFAVRDVSEQVTDCGKYPF
jgi:hypothetical protein